MNVPKYVLNKFKTSFEKLAFKSILKILEEAEKTYQRRVFIISGEGLRKYKIVGYLFSVFVFHKVKVKKIEKEIFTIFGWEGSESVFKKFKEAVFELLPDSLLKKVKIKPILLRKAREYIGRTYPCVFIDITKSIYPNDLGALVETVKGGGIVFIITNFDDIWLKENLKHHFDFASIPYLPDDAFRRFEKRFIKICLKSKGVYWLDLDGKRIILPEKEFQEESNNQLEHKIEIPSNTRYSKKLYQLCKTQDQVNVLRFLEDFVISDDKVFVLTANRGRGKSAVLGLFGTGYAISDVAYGTENILITSVNYPQTLMEFLQKGAEVLNLKFEKLKDGVRIGNINFTYIPPGEIINFRPKLMIVDEAAGIPVPLLFDFLNNAGKIIFSTTIHGYEGASRGFNVRFLKTIENMGIKMRKISMEEPIRYSKNCPVERWLYDTLLLDAEPVNLTEKDKQEIDKKSFIYQKIDLDEYFLDERKEQDLRNFIGIYVLAHYRNEPNDVAILADAPHYQAREVRLVNNKKIIGALEIAQEGTLPDDVIKNLMSIRNYYLKVGGHIIPTITCRYFKDEEFAKLKGLRIVRIAVHPDSFDKGIGSFILKNLEKEAKLEGYDWIGATFGASPKLVNFWIKNGFFPLYLAPVKNRISGEYSISVVKPLNDKTYSVLKRLNSIFINRLVNLIDSAYRDLEVDIFLNLIKGKMEKNLLKEKPQINEDEILRINIFRKEVIPWVYIADIAKKVAKAYFLEGADSKLDFNYQQKFIIVYNLLQNRGIKELAKFFGQTEKYWIVEAHFVFNKLLDYYFSGIIEPKEQKF